MNEFINIHVNNAFFNFTTLSSFFLCCAGVVRTAKDVAFDAGTTPLLRRPCKHGTERGNTMES
jgi:hypothetical protein